MCARRGTRDASGPNLCPTCCPSPKVVVEVPSTVTEDAITLAHQKGPRKDKGTPRLGRLFLALLLVHRTVCDSETPQG